MIFEDRGIFEDGDVFEERKLMGTWGVRLEEEG